MLTGMARYAGPAEGNDEDGWQAHRGRQDCGKISRTIPRPRPRPRPHRVLFGVSPGFYFSFGSTENYWGQSQHSALPFFCTHADSCGLMRCAAGEEETTKKKASLNTCKCVLAHWTSPLLLMAGLFVCMRAAHSYSGLTRNGERGAQTRMNAGACEHLNAGMCELLNVGVRADVCMCAASSCRAPSRLVCGQTRSNAGMWEHKNVGA